jgi:hypothetical protein
MCVLCKFCWKNVFPSIIIHLAASETRSEMCAGVHGKWSFILSDIYTKIKTVLRSLVQLSNTQFYENSFGGSVIVFHVQTDRWVDRQLFW